MQHHDSYLDAKEVLLDGITDEITNKVSPTLEATITAAAALDDSDSSLAMREQELGKLNDTLQSAIGETLFLRFSEMSALALEFYPGRPAPMVTPTQFMRDIEIRGTSLEDLFRRRSPSRFMKDLLKATPEETRHTVYSAIEHATWAAAALAEKFSWETTPLLMWITRPELSATGSCSVCTPLNGRKEKRRADFGVPYPAHPRCKCGIVPVNS